MGSDGSFRTRGCIVREIIVATADEGRRDQLVAAFSGIDASVKTLAEAGVKIALPPAGVLPKARMAFRQTRSTHPMSWIFAEARDPRKGIVLMNPAEMFRIFRGNDALSRVRVYLASLPRT